MGQHPHACLGNILTLNPGVNKCDGDICFHLAEISSDPGWSRCGPGKLANTGKVPAKIVRTEEGGNCRQMWVLAPRATGSRETGLGGDTRLILSSRGIFDHG